MDEQTRGFRSAIFGGFNREDVMHYIEETDTDTTPRPPSCALS